MKVHHSEHLVDMTRYLLSHSHELISLTSFAERYESAKSSISEDLGIIKKAFKERRYGILETISGAAGGILFIPEISYKKARKYIESLAKRLPEQDRLLPGGYVCLSDLLGEPELLCQIGRITTSKYLGEKINAIVAIAIKNVPIAQTVSYYLDAPSVIVRRDSKMTERSTISVNYVSGSSERIEKVELSKRSLKHGSRVLVVDDFMEDGGTVNGMKSLIREFESELVGITIFAESKFSEHRAINDHTSLLYIKGVNAQTKNTTVMPGSYFSK